MLNTTDVTPVTTTPESAPATTEEFSLKAYRAQREGRTAEPVEPKTTSEAPEPVVEQVDETAADSEPADEPEPTKEGEQPKKKEGGFQKRIKQLVAERDALKAQLAGTATVQPAAKPTEPQPAPAAAPAPQPAPFTEAEPQLEDFENIGAYTKALLKWDRAKAGFEQAQEQAERQQAEKRKAAIDGWNRRQSDAKAKHADYDAALAQVRDIAVPPALQHALLESEHGPEVAYHLAKHPDELKRIASLSPLAAARAIGQLEAAFSIGTPAQEQKPKVSSAPAPIRTVAGKAAAGAFDVKNASLKDYRLAREQGRVR